MNGDKVALGRTAGLLLGAAVLRLALFTLFPGLPDLLTGRVEISTPVNSFKRCKRRHHRSGEKGAKQHGTLAQTR